MAQDMALVGRNHSVCPGFLPPVPRGYGLRVSGEWLLLRNLGPHIKYYSLEHNGLWPTNWAQMTNTFFRSSPRLYSQSLFLPDHYVFIPHDQNWEIKTHYNREPLRIVMLRACPKTEKGKPTGRNAIVFYPSQNPDGREFTAEWLPENEITDLLTQSAILPPLQQHDSRTQWLNGRKQQRLAMIGGIFFLGMLLLTPIFCLIGAYHFVKHRPIG